ncbi:MAG TPA: hypothetical protein VG410_09915 [Solirubrobacteraceae bacterium]|jgi:hypothetical protein|nr:hypothetical protein [Solirubrobacteraceae bacterium]
MSEPKIDWSTAEVSNGKLVVAVDGELPKGYGRSFAATAHLLGNGNLADAKLKQGTVRVAVAEGEEEKLRHFLESVVQQANADHELTDDSDDEPDEDDAAEDDLFRGPDAEMTERFRAFSEDAR